MELSCKSSIAFACLLGLLCSCTERPAPPRPGAPSLKVSFRKSKFPAQGLIAGINNPSESEAITVTTAFIRSKGEKDERSYRLDHPIRPHDSMTLGWVELDGWKLQAGDAIRLKCERYEGTFDAEVPEIK